MKIKQKMCLIYLLILIALFPVKTNADERWSVRMAESVISKGAYKSAYEYVSATAMKGFRQLWKTTKDERYSQYIKEAVDSDLQMFYSLPSPSTRENYIDPVNGGNLLLMIYYQTQEEKYKAAIDSTLEYLLNFDRSAEGGFFHKNDPRMQIDDLYMEGEFLAEYAQAFDDSEQLDEALKQDGAYGKTHA